MKTSNCYNFFVAMVLIVQFTNAKRTSGDDVALHYLE